MERGASPSRQAPFCLHWRAPPAFQGYPKHRSSQNIPRLSDPPRSPSEHKENQSITWASRLVGVGAVAVPCVALVFHPSGSSAPPAGSSHPSSQCALCSVAASRPCVLVCVKSHSLSLTMQGLSAPHSSCVLGVALPGTHLTVIFRSGPGGVFFFPFPFQDGELGHLARPCGQPDLCAPYRK